MKSEAFKIVYAHLKMISFNVGMLEKWNLRLSKSSMRFFKILYALLSILFQFGRIWTKISDLTYVALKWYVLILEGWKNWIWGCFTSLCTSVLIPFYSNFDESGRIWIGTSWTYSCGIEMIFFNDEKLKKWNLRLLKSSMRIFKIHYALL